MPRRKKLSAAEQAAKEAEILNSPPDVSKEAVQALMSPKFEKATNMDAMQIALMLQELVRGQNSLLARYDDTNLQIAKLSERQDRADREIAERFESQQKFVEEVLDRAESLRRTGIENDKLIAKGVAEYQKARINAAAELAVSNMEFRKMLRNEKRVSVVSPGQLVTTMQNGQQVSVIIPEEIHVKDIHISLPVGQLVELPETLAAILSDRRKSQEETAKRVALLGRNLESTKLASEWNKISGSTEPMSV